MKSLALTDSAPVKQISVLLADDNARFRKALKLLVESDGDIKVVGEAKNGQEAVRLNTSLHPEVIIMDFSMPLLNGLEATRKIMETSPMTRVLIFSAHPDLEYITQAMLYGASGYLIKQSTSQPLAEAVREALKGNSYFSTSISRHIRDQGQKTFCLSESLKKESRPPLAFKLGLLRG